MNWGYKILFVYIIFIIGILFLVFKSSSQNQDLVMPDYYEQELLYQGKIDKMKNAAKLSSPVTFTQQNGQIIIQFPNELQNTTIEGDILLYYTADKKKDVRKLVTTKNGIVIFDVPAVNKGLHDLKIDWTASGTSYYSDIKIFIK